MIQTTPRSNHAFAAVLSAQRIEPPVPSPPHSQAVLSSRTPQPSFARRDFQPLFISLRPPNPRPLPSPIKQPQPFVISPSKSQQHSHLIPKLPSNPLANAPQTPPFPDHRPASAPNHPRKSPTQPINATPRNITYSLAEVSTGRRALLGAPMKQRMWRRGMWGDS